MSEKTVKKNVKPRKFNRKHKTAITITVTPQNLILFIAEEFELKLTDLIFIKAGRVKYENSFSLATVYNICNGAGVVVPVS